MKTKKSSNNVVDVNADELRKVMENMKLQYGKTAIEAGYSHGYFNGVFRIGKMNRGMISYLHCKYGIDPELYVIKNENEKDLKTAGGKNLTEQHTKQTELEVLENNLNELAEIVNELHCKILALRENDAIFEKEIEELKAKKERKWLWRK